MSWHTINWPSPSPYILPYALEYVPPPYVFDDPLITPDRYALDGEPLVQEPAF